MQIDTQAYFIRIGVELAFNSLPGHDWPFIIVVSRSLSIILDEISFEILKEAFQFL